MPSWHRPTAIDAWTIGQAAKALDDEMAATPYAQANERTAVAYRRDGRG